MIKIGLSGSKSSIVVWFTFVSEISSIETPMFVTFFLTYEMVAKVGDLQGHYFATASKSALEHLIDFVQQCVLTKATK